MSSKKWCFTFLITIILVAALYASYNVLVDPFGVFGDVIFDWYSYDMTNNPRVAKIGYLDKNENYKNYDSYVIGCSSTSSFSVEDLNKYFGGSWYNMIMYGADMLDVEQTTKYVIENYKPKNIMINVFVTNATKYNEEPEPLTLNMHCKLNGSSQLSFYSKYLFLNPMYSFAKIQATENDSYLTQPFDVFNVETGAYDKKVRDVEPIGSLDDYHEKYPIFINYPYADYPMIEIDNTVESIKRIKEMCIENNVNINFVVAPVYSKHLTCFNLGKVKEFYTKIANITNYWDFTTSSLTNDARFFYDDTHFRNCLGAMTLAKMANATDVYYPDDVGFYVTKDNVLKHIENLQYVNEDFGSYSTNVPILTYHSVVEFPTNDTNTVVSSKTFEAHIKALTDNGYTGIHLNQLIDYVEKGIPLPEKPICITFDDGYLDNYENAFPILQKYNMKATIFAIGSSVGSLTNYKDTDFPITPHFTLEQGNEMIASGLIAIQSHTYEMHDWAPYEESSSVIRENMLPLENESEQDYIDYVKNDHQLFESIFSNDIYALSFPFGYNATLTNVALKECGIKVTLTIEDGINTVVQGLPQSLLNLKRINMIDSTSTEQLLEKIAN